MQQWNLTIQKKLPWSTYVDIGYVGSKGNNLTMAFDGNRPLQVVVPGPSVAPITARRPLQGFGAITVTKSIGNSTYHSLQIKGERRVAKGLSELAAYTYSKSLADADRLRGGAGDGRRYDRNRSRLAPHGGSRAVRAAE